MLEIYFPGKKEGEEVVGLFRLHPLVFSKDFILGGIIILLPFIVLYKTGFGTIFYTLLVASLLGSAFFIIRGFFLYLNSFLLITNLRAILFNQKGFFHKEIDEVYLENTCQVEVEKKGVLATLFNFGELVVQTQATFKVRNLEKPSLAKRVIFDVLQNHKGKNLPSSKGVLLR